LRLRFGPQQDGGLHPPWQEQIPDRKHQRDEAAKERRISEEKARYEQGFPTAGHNEPGRESDPIAKRERLLLHTSAWPISI
jgi:hypothetical protein